MNKVQFINTVFDYMKDNDIRKPMPTKKHTFYISDENNNTKEFIVREASQKMVYSKNDVERILDAMIDVVEYAIQTGETVTIHGFGSLGLKYRKPRKTVLLGEKECVVDGRYVPKFNYGNDLRMAAKIYEVTKGCNSSDELIIYETDTDGGRVEI